MDKKKPFPLRLAPVPGGWHMVIHLENGQSHPLLKPGRTAEDTQAYLFGSQQEAWRLIKKLFYFCMTQTPTQGLSITAIVSCKQCARTFRAKFFDCCAQCLQSNEFMLQQLWQGFYYLTDPEDSTLQKVYRLLKISGEEFARMPEGYKTIVQHQLLLYTDIENRKSSPEQRLGKILKTHSHFHLAKKQ
jgi:hypothetical protein